MIDKKIQNNGPEAPDRAVIVAVIRPGQSEAQLKEHLEELAFLARTSHIETLGIITQRLERPDSRSYVGKGKLEDVAAAVAAYELTCVVFDDDLTPAQVRHLENELKVNILDRSLLILNIFSLRAQTAQAKAQVELAQYQYLYPRLTRMWTHLSKQRGGGAGMRGPGEKELETDRRIVKDRIAFLKTRLVEIDKQSVTRRKTRDQLTRVALVGYTNVGKSTLMNRLTQAGVLAEDKLFATVDSTVRKGAIADIPYLLTDTVGFIRKLPTHLVEAFKSTLDEVREADVLIHVVDLSSPAHEEHLEVVHRILNDIGAGDKPTLYALNKIDALSSGNNGVGKEQAPPLALPASKGEAVESEGHQAEDSSRPMPNPLARLTVSRLIPGLAGGVPSTPNIPTEHVYLSAATGEGIAELKQTLFRMVRPVHTAIYPNYLQQVSL